MVGAIELFDPQDFPLTMAVVFTYYVPNRTLSALPFPTLLANALIK
jgi:hypothetical protein